MTLQRLSTLFILITLVIAGCNVPAQSPTPTLAESPTLPPQRTCTPPLCQAGESYAFGECGSCCTTCASPTPPETTPITPQRTCTPPLCQLGESYVFGECGSCCTTCASPTPPDSSTECPPVSCFVGEVYAIGGCGNSCCTTCATPTFYPMCTPPFCSEGEVYVGGGCPGACCTSCGTPTPESQQPPAGICPILATRTPQPQAPTRVAETPSGSQVDPHVELCVSRVTLRTGEYLNVDAFSVDIGMAYYYLFIQDAGSADINTEIRLESGSWRAISNDSKVLYVQEVTGDYDRANFYVRAIAPGTVDLWVNATGEVHFGYPGPATWAGGGSEVIRIEVIP